MPIDGTTTDTQNRRFSSPWQIVGFLSLAFAINYIDRQFLFSAFPAIAKDLSLSNIELALTGSLFTWTYAGCMPLSGWIADRYSRHALIAAALALWSTACLGTALSRTVVELLVSRVAMGITESLYVPAAVALISDLHAEETRSRALSIHGFAQFIGIALGGFYGGWSADHIGWRYGYASLSIVGLAYSIFLAAWLRVDRKSIRRQAQLSSSSGVMRSPLLHIISLCFFAFCALLWIIYAWTPTFIHQRYGLNLTSSGLAATFYVQSGAAAGILLGGWAGDSFSIRRATGRVDTTACGFLVCAPFAAVMFIAHSIFWFKLAAELFGLTSGFFVANIFASLYDFVAHESLGLATGWVNMIGGLGAGAAILLAGVMQDRSGIGLLMIWTSAVCVVLAVGLFISVRFVRFRTGSSAAGPSC